MLNKENFWKNKRVLLTGHTGFKGSWLALWLASMGADVTGYALKPLSTPNLFDICQIKNKITSIEGDICDAQHIQSVCEKLQPEVVIHMAAQSLVLPSYDDPISTYNTNVMGTLHVFEAARKTNSCRVILNVTSDKCYENKEWVWAYREDEAMGGYDPYSSSKGCAEILTSAYRRSYFSTTDKTKKPITLITARAGNCIGGGDWSESRIIPDIIRAFTANQTVAIRSPHAIRPWQHVLEPLSGYLLLAEKGWASSEVAQGWNFGPHPQDIQPVSWIVDRTAKILGPTFKYECNPEAIKQYEAKTLRVDATKAYVELGWSPKLSLDQTIDWTIGWYQAYLQEQDMTKKTMQQINAYSDLLNMNVESTRQKAGEAIV